MSVLSMNGVNYAISSQGDGLPILLLHGFTGCAQSWNGVLERLASRHQVIAPDIIGHGSSDSPAEIGRYRMASAAADIVDLLHAMTASPVHLVGYSMGGRLALYLALHYPSSFRSLTLESASPGLKTEAERQARRESDEQLAARIHAEGIESFVDFWESLPLWESQKQLPADLLQRQRQLRLANTPLGLANSLRGMGTGAQPSLWDDLPYLNMPVQLIAGELDSKFCAINHEMHAALPDSRLSIVPGAGHSVHLEKSGQVAQMITNFVHEVDHRRRQNYPQASIDA